MNFLKSRIIPDKPAEPEHLLVVDGSNNILFDGDPMTLPNGILSIPPVFVGGSIIYHFHLKPKDMNCPTAVMEFEYDGGSLELLSSGANREAKDEEEKPEEKFEPPKLEAGDNC